MGDLRDQLKAAMHSDDTSETPETPTPEAATPEPVETQAVEAPVEGAQDRDDHGRFKPKEQAPEAGAAPATAEAQQTETATPAEPEAPKEPIRIPPSLPAAVKAKFEALDPDVQSAFHKLEETVQTAKAEWGKKGERLNRYDEILGPHVDRWRIAGLDEFSGIQTLLSAQNILDKDPVGGILHIARSYGVTPQHLAQAFGVQVIGPQSGAEGHMAPTQQPDFAAVLQSYLQPVMQEVQTLRQSQEHREFSAAQAEVESFATDPKNRYFEDVRPLVAHLIDSGQADTLQDAYDKAIWMSPDIRPLLLQEAQAPARPDPKKAAEQAQRQKAQQAKQAGVSVTGGPSGAVAPPQVSSGNLRADLEAAMRQHQPQV